LLQPGEITMMLGRQKEGKSTLALQLAIDIGGGSHFLEEFPTQTGKVLYIDFENKYEQIQKRVLDLGAKHEANLKNVAVQAYKRAIDRDVSLYGDGAAHLKEIIEEKEPELLILDPLRYAAAEKGRSEENWALNMIDAVQEIQSVRPSMAVLLVHHLRKAGEDGGPTLRDDPRTWIEKCFGSQALLAHVDSIWGLAAEVEGYTFATVPRSVEQLTVRLHKLPESERFFISDDRLESLSPEQREYFSKLPQQFTYAQAITLGIPKGSAGRLIRRCKSSGLLKVDEDGQYRKVEERKW